MKRILTNLKECGAVGVVFFEFLGQLFSINGCFVYFYRKNFMKKVFLLLVASAAFLTGCLKDPGTIVSVKTKNSAGQYTNTFAVGDTIFAEAAISDQAFEQISWYVASNDVAPITLISYDNTNAVYIATGIGTGNVSLKIENCNKNSKCRQEYGDVSVTIQ
jgi:hypothetical protein